MYVSCLNIVSGDGFAHFYLKLLISWAILLSLTKLYTVLAQDFFQIQWENARMLNVRILLVHFGFAVNKLSIKTILYVVTPFRRRREIVCIFAHQVGSWIYWQEVLHWLSFSKYSCNNKRLWPPLVQPKDLFYIRIYKIIDIPTLIYVP